jgi:hypothetical protein
MFTANFSWTSIICLLLVPLSRKMVAGALLSDTWPNCDFGALPRPLNPEAALQYLIRSRLTQKKYELFYPASERAIFLYEAGPCAFELGFQTIIILKYGARPSAGFSLGGKTLPERRRFPIGWCWRFRPRLRRPFPPTIFEQPTSFPHEYTQIKFTNTRWLIVTSDLRK